MDENIKKVCKYCGKELHEFDCSSLSTKNEIPTNKFLRWIYKVFMIIEMPLTFLQLFVVETSKNRKFEEAGKIITCTNRDCIGYLEGCLGKGKGLFV